MNKLVTTVITATLATGVVMASAGTSHAGTSLRVKALGTAAKQKNDPYKGGATGPNAFDCSGLTVYAFKKHGKKLPRTAQGQYNKSKKISIKKLTKGDLVFFGTSSKNIKHVGIYAGKGKIWNANSGSYRGWKVVLAPAKEYTKGKKMYGGRY